MNAKVNASTLVRETPCSSEARNKATLEPTICIVSNNEKLCDVIKLKCDATLEHQVPDNSVVSLLSLQKKREKGRRFSLEKRLIGIFPVFFTPRDITTTLTNLLNGIIYSIASIVLVIVFLSERSDCGKVEKWSNGAVVFWCRSDFSLAQASVCLAASCEIRAFQDLSDAELKKFARQFENL